MFTMDGYMAKIKLRFQRQIFCDKETLGRYQDTSLIVISETISKYFSYK